MPSGLRKQATKQRPVSTRRTTSVPESCAGLIPVRQGRNSGGEGGIGNDQEDGDRASQGTDHESGKQRNVLSCLYAVRGVEDVPSGGGLPIDRATALVPETTAERFDQATVTVI